MNILDLWCLFGYIYKTLNVFFLVIVSLICIDAFIKALMKRVIFICSFFIVCILCRFIRLCDYLVVTMLHDLSTTSVEFVLKKLQLQVSKSVVVSDFITPIPNSIEKQEAMLQVNLK